MPTAVADTASITLDREGNEIMVLARSKLLTLLRQLDEQTSLLADEAARRHKDRGLVGDVKNSVAHIIGQIRGQQHDPRLTQQSVEELQAQLADEMRILELRIALFIDLAAQAGSPREYAQDLRERSNALGRLLVEGRLDSAMSLETFKELTRILDIVQLTRRDVERRNLDQVRAAARFVLSKLPLDDASAVEQILSAPPSTVEAWADGTETPPAAERARVITVAQVVYDLWHSLTPDGLVAWFTKAFDEFGGRSPVELLDSASPSDIQHLRTFARSLRTQVAT